MQRLFFKSCVSNSFIELSVGETKKITIFARNLLGFAVNLKEYKVTFSTENNLIKVSGGTNVSDGIKVSDGTNVSDGINVSDGTNLSDGTNVSDGIKVSDGTNISGGIIEAVKAGQDILTVCASFGK